MAEIKFSQLTTAAQLTNDDIFALAQTQGGSLSSVKTSMIAVANFLNTQVQYTTAYNTQAKTTAGAINELKQLISLIPQFSIEVVEELPTEDISDTTIYLVPAEDPEVGNYYEEYIHVNDSWELVGTTAVDLSAYYTKLEVDGLLATKASVEEVALKENKTDMPTDVRSIIKDCKTPKSATITNGIAQFECIEENLVKGLKVTMNPIQDLHGQSAPYPAGGGKNKLPFDINYIKANNTNGTWSGNAYTYRGVTYNLSDDGKINVTGTVSSENASAITLINNVSFPSGSYILNGVTNGSSGTYRLRYAINSGNYISVYDGDSSVITLNGTDTLRVQIYMSSDFVCPTGGLTLEPMIRLSSVADSTFAPYENICPISGRTEASVKRTGVNQWDEVWEVGTISTSNGTPSPSSNYIRSKNFCVCEPNKSYYITHGAHQAVVFWYDENEGFLSYDASGSTESGKVVTSHANAKFFKVRYGDSAGVQTYDNSISLNYPSTDTAYHAYTAETKIHQYSETIYAGVDDFVNGGATSTKKYIELDENSNWEVGAGAVWFFIGGDADLPTGTIIDSRLCSNMFKNGYNQDNSIWVIYKQIHIRPNSTIAPSGATAEGLAEFKNWLSTNNYKIQVCVELATPTTISTSAEEITTVSGTNIISGTEPISECKYTELATVDDLIKIIGGQ